MISACNCFERFILWSEPLGLRITKCIVFFYTGSKHRCPTHSNFTSIGDRFDGCTTHQLAFAAQDPQPRRRGLAIPPVTLPHISRVVDVTSDSVHRQDYVTHPCGKRSSCKKDCKIDPAPVTSFSDVTSYSQDFPPRPLAALRAPRKPKLQTAPFSVDLSRQIYTTTNNVMFRKWGPFERAQALGDPPPQLAFEGEFLGRSVAREDFNSDVLCKGRPSTTFKKIDISSKQYETFDDNTTNKTAFAAISRDQQEVPTLFLKRRSQKHAETMAPPTSTVEGITQIEKECRLGSSQSYQPQKRRGLCIPHPDMLRLFEGTMETMSEHADSYQIWSDALPAQKLNRTEDSFRKEDRAGKRFDDKTSNMLSYIPIHPATIANTCRDANAMATSNSRFDRDGVQAKEAQDFGEPFHKSTVTGSDYFRFWKVTPRYRHGDRYESMRDESSGENVRMEGNSEMKMSFVPHRGVEPAKSFKPAMLPLVSSSAPSRLSNSCTEYRKEFTSKPIAANICPALLILHKQPL